jgi:hypothetical protein
MIVYKELLQKTPEWFKIKWGKVGGSTSKGLFVLSDTLFLDMLSEITEDFQMEEDGYVSNDMQDGIDREPIAFEKLCQFTGIKFETAGWLQCEEIPILGISPDGITADETISCEAKCPARKMHIETVLNNEIPSKNIHQCLHYFTVNPKLETHYFCSYRPESIRPLWIKKLTLDSIIDLGTKSKPVCKTIREWVGIAKFNALELEANLQIALKQLEKI